MRYISYVITVATVLCFMGSATAQASKVDSAKAFVEKLNDSTFSIMKSDATPLQKDKKLRKILFSSVDLPWIAKFVLGRHWRTASETQKEQYTDAYRDYIAFTYLPHFREYRNQAINLGKAIDLGGGKYSVSTTLTQPDHPDLPITYMLHTDKAGKLKLYDFNVEGTSMIATQRDDFDSVLSRKGVDFLISRLSAIVEKDRVALANTK